MENMLDGTNLSTANYDDFLNHIHNEEHSYAVELGAAGVKYSSASAAARQSLIDDDHWVIHDAGQV
jgi:hypothetical protein